MALALLILFSFMVYATSRYFPRQDLPLVVEHKSKVLVLAGAISLLSLFLLNQVYDFGTALMIWLTGLMTILSAVIISVKMNVK